MLESLLNDVLDKLKTPEIQSDIQLYIVKPILQVLYPYILGAMILWGIMFICLALILLILVRGSLVDIPLIVLGKQQFH